MSEVKRAGKDFIGYEYKELNTGSHQFSLCLDCYKNFGWKPDESFPITQKGQHSVIQLKRDRKIINRMELTRLERNFEACIAEIDTLEKAKFRGARICALTVGVTGTAFWAASTFAATHAPPLIELCILLAVPGFLGWILPYFLYCKLKADKSEKIAPLIEQKYDEIYVLCEKGNKLLDT